jgi:hypothetical protein
MTRYVDCTLAPDGTLYVITDTGDILHQNPDIGVGFQNLPESKRPRFIWAPLQPAPSFRVKRLFAGAMGKLLALDTDGQLHERLPDRTSMRGARYFWHPLEVPDV